MDCRIKISITFLILFGISFCSQNELKYSDFNLLLTKDEILPQNSSNVDFINNLELNNERYTCMVELYWDQDHDNFGSGYYGCTTYLKYILYFSYDMATNGTDCDDNNYKTYPGAPEIEDLKDNDCDALVDEGKVVKPKSTIVSGATFDFTDGVYLDSNTCSNFTSTIDIIAFQTERTYILSHLSSSIYPAKVQIMDAETNSIITTGSISTTSSYYNIKENVSEGLLELTIKPYNFCSYISNTSRNYIRITYGFDSQEDGYKDSFFIRNSYPTTMPNGVSYKTTVSDGVKFLLYPIFFDEFSEATEDIVVELLKRGGIKTGSSYQSASTSSDYSSVDFKLYPNSSTKRYDIEVSASGIYKVNDCLNWVYFNKPKIKLDIQLKVPSVNEALAENTWGNFNSHDVYYYALSDLDDCSPSVNYVYSHFADINSNTEKKYVARDSQLAIDLNSLYFTLNNLQPTEHTQVNSSDNLFDNLVYIGYFNGLINYPGEEIIGGISFFTYYNEILTYALKENDLFYNNKNTAAKMQYYLRDFYKNAWPDKLADAHSLDLQRFMGSHSYATSSTNPGNAHGDIVGAIEYYINSILTFGLSSIQWMCNIEQLAWSIKLKATSILNNGSYFTFSSSVTGELDGNKQEYFPFFQKTTAIPYDENNYNLDINSVASVNADLGQQFISSSVKTGQWNVDNIINFESEPIIEKINKNVIYLKTKNFLFGGDYIWNGVKLDEFFRVDAKAKVIVNQTTPSFVQTTVENYLGVKTENDWVIAIDATASITTEDITYVEPVAPTLNHLDYSTLKMIGVESLYYLLHWLACFHYRDATGDKNTIDGWNFMIPIDDTGLWAAKNPGVPLTKENYCADIMNGYVTRYLMYIRFQNTPDPQVVTPIVIQKSTDTHQMDFGIKIKMFDVDDFLSDPPSSETGSWGSCPPSDTVNEKCYDPDTDSGNK